MTIMIAQEFAERCREVTVKLKVFSRPIAGSNWIIGGGFITTPKRRGHEKSQSLKKSFCTLSLYSNHTLAGSHGKAVSRCTDTLIGTRCVGTHSVV